MISGFWSASFPLPLIRVAVTVEGIRPDWALVPFVLDTGASHSCIHPLAATRILGMSPASLDSTNWPESRPSMGVGGDANYLTRTAHYALLHDDHPSTAPEIVVGSVLIGEMSSANQAIPSLLGWDVLQYFRITLNGRESLYLERI